MKIHVFLISLLLTFSSYGAEISLKQALESFGKNRPFLKDDDYMKDFFTMLRTHCPSYEFVNLDRKKGYIVLLRRTKDDVKFVVIKGKQ